MLDTQHMDRSLWQKRYTVLLSMGYRGLGPVNDDFSSLINHGIPSDKI